MIERTGELRLGPQSKGKGATLFQQNWLPDGPARAVIVLAHGYAEHIGRYRYFAEHCTTRGIAVYGLDHWGHGKSDGDYGFVKRFSVYLDGVHALTAKAKSDHPGLPVFLVGHSMGGLIATNYLIERSDAFTGVILSGPAIEPADEPSVLLMLVSRILSAVAPKMGVLGLDAHAISRDPSVVTAYQNDPLVYGGKISARLALEMLKAMQNAEAKAAQIQLPMLLLHGAYDTLATPEGSQMLFDTISSDDKQIKIYPEMYHEIFNEPERDDVLSDMTDWMNARIPASA